MFWPTRFCIMSSASLGQEKVGHYRITFSTQECSVIGFLLFFFLPLSALEEMDMMQSLSSDPKNLERLMERPSYQDYQRVGLGSFSIAGQRSSPEPFRLSTVNATYSVCRR